MASFGSSFVDAIVSEALSRPDGPSLQVNGFLTRNRCVRHPQPPRERPETTIATDDVYEPQLTMSLYHQTDNVRDVQFSERTTDVNLPGRIPGPYRSIRQPYIFTAVREGFPRESSHRPRSRAVPSTAPMQKCEASPAKSAWMKSYGLAWDPQTEYTDSFRLDPEAKSATIPSDPTSKVLPTQCRSLCNESPYHRSYTAFNQYGKRRLSKRIK